MTRILKINTFQISESLVSYIISNIKRKMVVDIEGKGMIYKDTFSGNNRTDLE